MTTWPNNVVRIAQAIAKAEGFGIPGAIPTLANNPGDLTAGDAGSFPTLGTMNEEGVIHFANLADGWTRLYVKVTRMLGGQSAVYPLTMTLEQVGLKYSGGDPNWATNVAAALGVSVTITLQELSQVN